jgi:hypothetical protein
MNTTQPTPAWLEKPFHLTAEEIQNPLQVLEEFCWQYSPTEVRMKLKDWYAASLSDDVADTKSIFTTYENVEKLIEAVYLLQMQQPA